MKEIYQANNLTRALATMRLSPVRSMGFSTGFAILDQLLPCRQLQFRAIHELLSPDPDLFPKSLALLVGKAALKEENVMAWIDPALEIHLPSFSACGMDLRRLIFVRARTRSDQLWATAECLRCAGVGATISFIDRLTQIEARRLQLAAERGGGVGIFLRPYIPRSNGCYAAATRWLVQPAPGDDRAQRWSMQLIHGHGGQIGKTVLLEVNRETRAVCVSEPLVNRQAAPAAIRFTA